MVQSQEPDEQDVARGATQGDDKRAYDRESQEVGEDAIAALSVRTVSRRGRQVVGPLASLCHTLALLEHLARPHTASGQHPGLGSHPINIRKVRARPPSLSLSPYSSLIHGKYDIRLSMEKHM